jgi:hypothetical protein
MFKISCHLKFLEAFECVAPHWQVKEKLSISQNIQQIHIGLLKLDCENENAKFSVAWSFQKCLEFSKAPKSTIPCQQFKAKLLVSRNIQVHTKLLKLDCKNTHINAHSLHFAINALTPLKQLQQRHHYCCPQLSILSPKPWSLKIDRCIVASFDLNPNPKRMVHIRTKYEYDKVIIC